MIEPVRGTFTLYEANPGARTVRKEIDKALRRPELVEVLFALLERIERGEARPNQDIKHLGNGLWEARMSDRDSAYRMYFARVGSTKLNPVGLAVSQEGWSRSSR